jgi:predicted nucleic acid-binding protein
MIFVDAGLFYARLAEDDENHAAANLFFNGLALSLPLITTNIVVYEAHALLLRLDRGPPRAAVDPVSRRFLHQVDAGLCRVVNVTDGDHRAARELLERHRDKSYSFCNALSFIVMERFGLEIAASFDRHFKQYGKFTVLPWPRWRQASIGRLLHSQRHGASALSGETALASFRGMMRRRCTISG